MFLWTFLFTLFAILFGAAVLIWWRLDSEKRRSRLARGIASEAEAIGASFAPVVLVEPPVQKSWIAGLFHSGKPAAQAGEKAGWSHGGFVLLTLGTVFAGFMLGMKLVDIIGPSAPYFAAIGLGIVPWRLRLKREKKRLRQIEEQFPDALDFLARSVRAGNAFSVGLELLAHEASEPLRQEIVRLTREVALGAPLEDALNGLMVRIPLFEVRYFVSAALLQRETGGNLSEVLMKLAISVRDRLRLRGQIKAHSGQARLTATVLTVLPIATLLILKMFSPDYMDSLTGDPMGRNLLCLAALSQILGYIVMKRLVNIEV